MVQEVESGRSCWTPLPPVASLCAVALEAVPAVQSTSHTTDRKVVDCQERSGQPDSWRSVRKYVYPFS